MTTNKNALIRYKILDKCFRNPGKRYFIDDLIKECESSLLEIDPNSNGISRRQIFDDISFMESSEGWNIDLERHKDGKRVYYRYANLDFSINNMPLNEMELNQINEAMSIFTQFKGMPQFEWMGKIIPKLQQGLSLNKSSKPFFDFENNEYLTGIEHLGIIYNAIHYKKPLEISYKPFDNTSPYNLIIHPYYLKQYNNRWFLFGYNTENTKYDWNLAIDRIVSINELNISYVENNQIDWSEYFEDIIGVTKPVNAKIEIVKMQFKGITGKYMESKPVHGSQKSKWIDDFTLELSLNIIINYELERFILSYADNVIVLEPESLKTNITNRLNLAIKNYSSN